jgi:predicted metal-binding membrane protein
LNFAIASVLIVTTAAAWISVYYLMPMMGMPITGGMIGMFVSPDINSLLLFVVIWVVGMVAMMFPAMIPVISIYKTAFAESTSHSSFGSALFLGGYLAMYVFLGLAAYLGGLLVLVTMSMMQFAANYALFSGIVLMGTGLWQLTPFKNACLKNCVSPLGFFMSHMKKGLTGAVRMGAEHGYYCVGCCYLYMIVMFVVAGMSLSAMALLAIMITLEKALLKGARWFTALISAVFITLSLIALISPDFIMMILT